MKFAPGRGGDVLTNLAFGGDDGRTLYITAGKSLFSTPVAIAGEVAYPSWCSPVNRVDWRDN